MFRDLQNSEASPGREDITSNAANLHSFNPVEQESQAHQDQQKQTTDDLPDCQGNVHLSSSEDEEPPPPPPKDTPVPPAENFTDVESYSTPWVFHEPLRSTLSPASPSPISCLNSQPLVCHKRRPFPPASQHYQLHLPLLKLLVEQLGRSRGGYRKLQRY
jgi:hypothetical protein